MIPSVQALQLVPLQSAFPSIPAISAFAPSLPRIPFATLPLPVHVSPLDAHASRRVTLSFVWQTTQRPQSPIRIDHLRRDRLTASASSRASRVRLVQPRIVSYALAFLVARFRPLWRYLGIGRGDTGRGPGQARASWLGW
jgi:hypothetical protein